MQVRAMLQQQSTYVKRLDDSSAPANSVAPAVEQSKAGELLRLPLVYPGAGSAVPCSGQLMYG